METFHIWIEVVLTWLYTFSKTHQNVHLKWKHLVIYKSFCNIHFLKNNNKRQVPKCSISCRLSPRVWAVKAASTLLRTMPAHPTPPHAQANMYLAPRPSCVLLLWQKALAPVNPNIRSGPEAVQPTLCSLLPLDPTQVFWGKWRVPPPK